MLHRNSYPSPWLDIVGHDTAGLRNQFEEFRLQDDSRISYVVIILLAAAIMATFIRHTLLTLPHKDGYSTGMIIISAVAVLLLFSLVVLNKVFECCCVRVIKNNQVMNDISDEASISSLSANCKKVAKQPHSSKKIKTKPQPSWNQEKKELLWTIQSLLQYGTMWLCNISILSFIIFLVVLKNHWHDNASNAVIPADDTLPEGIMAAAFFLPISLYFVFKHVSIRTVLLVLFSVFITTIILIVYFGLSNSLTKLLFGFIMAIFICIEYHRQFWHSFVMNQHLQEINAENVKLAEEVKASELRHMIGNMAHDLKTPLSSFISGIDVIRSIVQELRQEIDAYHKTLPDKCPLLVLAKDKAESILEIADTVTKTNIFMIMTINRCIDYNKTLFNVQLTAKCDTVRLEDCLRFVDNCIQSTITNGCRIDWRYLSDSLQDTSLKTDKQWLLENLLCVLGNAVKYSKANSLIQILMDKVEVTIDSRPMQDPPKCPSNGFSFKSLVRSMKSKKMNPFGNERLETTMPSTGRQLMEESLHGSTSKPKLGVVKHILPNSRNSCPSEDNRSLMVNQDENSIVHAQQRTGPLQSTKGEDLDVMEAGHASRPCSVVSSNRYQWEHCAEDEKIEQQHLRFMIIDDGPGIAKEFIPDLFKEPAQTARLTGGTGLGLYSLARRIETLGGQCGVVNLTDKKGVHDLFALSQSNIEPPSMNETGCAIWFTIPFHQDERAMSTKHGNKDYGDSPQSRRQASSVPQDSPSPLVALPNIEKRKPLEKPSPLNIPPAFTVPNPSSNIVPKTPISQCATLVTEFNAEPLLAVDQLKTLFPRVLVVDDSATIVKMTSMSLKKQGHIVSSAENGLIALDMITNYAANRKQDDPLNAFDVILMDFQMPVMDGIEAIKAIRQFEFIAISEPTYVPLPIIGFSAKSDEDQIEEAYLQGMDFFLPKPFLIKSFQDILLQVITSRQKRNVVPLTPRHR